MPYLSHAPEERIRFTWEGRSIEARAGVSVAAALYGAGITTFGRSRKFRRPRGLSGSFPGGHLVTIDGIPHCRSDSVMVRNDMQVRAENVWPSLNLDLLRLGGLLPRHWVRAGFEHPRWLPDSSVFWPLWEKALWNAAGTVPPPVQSSGAIPGRRLSAETVVIGGGPAGCEAATEAAKAGQGPVILICEGSPSNFPSSVQVFASHRVFALYRGGRVVGAAPLDPSHPAILIDANNIVLATGRRSVPPLVAGADLPGVLDATTALKMAGRDGVAPGSKVVVIGTNDAGKGRSAVADHLRGFGVQVIDIIDVSRVQRITGRARVEGIEADGLIACDSVVHAGPWRADPVLPFQSAWSGELRLMPGTLPDHIHLVGGAAQPSEAVVMPGQLDGRALVCPCMDVTVDEIQQLVASGETHVEVLKRRTSCGMGPCQGVPCWDNLAALVARLTGQSPEAIGHPTYRPPRAGLTLAQAAGLESHVAWNRGGERDG